MSSIDPEQQRAEAWVSGQEVDVPYVLDEKGDKVYQIRYYPLQRPSVRPFNREEGLGYFSCMKMRMLQDFLDECIDDPRDLCALACTSRTFNVYVSDDKYVTN